MLRRLRSLRIHEQARDGAGGKGVAVGLRKPIAGPTLIVDPSTGLLLAKREPTFTGTPPKPVVAEEGQTRYLQYGVVPSVVATPG